MTVTIEDDDNKYLLIVVDYINMNRNGTSSDKQYHSERPKIRFLVFEW